MNSNGIKTLIKWIKKIIALPDEKKIEIIININSIISWQKTSLQMLSTLSPKLIKIQTT